jgi:hypothetical protein
MRHLIDALRARPRPHRTRRPLGPWIVAAVAAAAAVGSTILVWQLVRKPPPASAPQAGPAPQPASAPAPDAPPPPDAPQR